jgi:hypothetical protein
MGRALQPDDMWTDSRSSKRLDAQHRWTDSRLKQRTLGHGEPYADALKDFSRESVHLYETQSARVGEGGGRLGMER